MSETNRTGEKSSRRCSFRSAAPEVTHALGAALAGAVLPELADAALVCGLCGPLGAGKTAFAKGFAEGLGLDPRAVSSPTFTLANEYPLATAPRAQAALAGSESLATEELRWVHADLYRLEAASELLSLGLDEWDEPGCVALIEWSDRFAEALPREQLRSEIQKAPDPEGRGTSRSLDVSALGAVPERVLARWQAAASG